MANAPDTTNPSAERNSVSEMIFDMDDNLTRLQAELDVLEELTQSYKLASATDNQTNVDWTIGKVLGATHELRERFDKVFHATRDRGQTKPEPVKPAARAKPAEGTVFQLCHQWDVVKAKLDLDLLQSSGDELDKENDRIIDAAREQFRAIERSILDADPDTLRNVDLVVMLRLARKVIGNDEFTDEQEERCHGMLDAIDGALTRRTEPGDWGTEVQS